MQPVHIPRLVPLLVLLAGYSHANAGEVPAPRFEDLPTFHSAFFDAKMARPRVGDHRSFILIPTNPSAGAKKLWVWYAPTVLGDREQDWVSPGKRHAWIFRRLLDAGIYVAGVDVGESYGSPAGQIVYDQFYKLLVKRYGFASKPALLPISRGGLMAYNWATANPRHVSCIGAIYPLCNLATYRNLETIATAYGMTVGRLRAEIDKFNPVDHLQPLARAGVPILHVHGDRDTTVPLPLQSGELVRRYRALGGPAQLIVVHGKGHEVAPEYWQEPRLVAFFVNHLGAEPDEHADQR